MSVTATFYARGDGTWTVLGYDRIEDWLLEQGEAAVEVVDPAEIVAWLRGRTGYGGGFTCADDVADAIELRFITERGQ